MAQECGGSSNPMAPGVATVWGRERAWKRGGVGALVPVYTCCSVRSRVTPGLEEPTEEQRRKEPPASPMFPGAGRRPGCSR